MRNLFLISPLLFFLPATIFYYLFPPFSPHDGVMKIGEFEVLYVNTSDSVDTKLELYHTLEETIEYTQFNLKFPETLTVDSARIWENPDKMVWVKLYSKANNVYDYPGTIITHACILDGQVMNSASNVREYFDPIGQMDWWK